MNENYFTINDDYYISKPDTKVVVTDIITFRDGNNVIGKLDATIDFKDLSPELHQRAIQLLQQMPVSLYGAGTVSSGPSATASRTYPPKVKERVNQWPHAWRGVKGWFKKWMK